MPTEARPSGRRRLRRALAWVGVAVLTLLACCGASSAYLDWQDRVEQRRIADAVGTYLRHVQHGDRAAATAMLCGGDDTELVDHGEIDWTTTHVTAFTVVDAWDWSSWHDGHGSTYRVRLNLADGSTAMADIVVEVIADDPCIGTEIPV